MVLVYIEIALVYIRLTSVESFSFKSTTFPTTLPEEDCQREVETRFRN